MGSLNTTRRGRQRNKVLPKKTDHVSKSRSRERSSIRAKRSVSFEKGVGRRRSSTLSEERNPLSRLIRGLSPKKKKKRRRGSGSSKSSGKSLQSSRGSSVTFSRSSSVASQSGSRKGQRSRSSSQVSRSRSRSSSKSTTKGSKKVPLSKNRNQRAKLQEKPKSAKHRLKSILSSGKSSTGKKNNGKGRDKEKKNRGGRKKKEGKSEKESAKSKGKDRHYYIDERPKLERVVFTEDYEKKLRQKQKQLEFIKPTASRRRSSAKLYDKNSASLMGKTRDRPRTASSMQEKRSPDDYRFYKDPNIPGHAFPYDYLSYLLAVEGGKRQRKSDNNSGVERIVLEPAPVKTQLSRRPLSAGPRTLNLRGSSASPKPNRKSKTKSILNNSESKSLLLNRTHSSATEPGIRHGTGSKKCSWTAEDELKKPKYPGSDHQLKNTGNPAVLAWLRHKDDQLRARRQNELRTRRRKTAKLIDEQNDLEDKHERALGKYELWKKQKDREILLRRREEAKEASSAAFTKKDGEVQTSKRKDRPRTANGLRSSSSGTAYSELRSSSASHNSIEHIKKPRRQRRPKSAVPAGVSFSDDIEVPPIQRPRSATPPPKSHPSEAKQHLNVFQKTENFFKNFLGVGGHHEKSGHSDQHTTPQQHPPPEQQQQRANAMDDKNTVIETEDRNAYDNWVRSSASADGGSSSKPKGKHQPRGSPSRNKYQEDARPPPRNLSDDDLVTNLEKRRIKTILASRKEARATLPKGPLPGPSQAKQGLPRKAVVRAPRAKSLGESR